MVKRKCPFCNIEFEFKSNQQFGAHKTNCKLNPKRKETIEKITLSSFSNRKKYKFVCDCKKIFYQELTIKQYENNRSRKFCSRSCANKRNHSKETKSKISNTLQNRPENKGKRNKIKRKNKCTNIKLHICCICNREKYVRESHSLQTCGKKECVNKLIAKNVTGKTGGYKTKSGRSKFNGCYYDGVWLDSSWELKCVKMLDRNNIKWDRTSKIFLTYHDKNGKERKYYPDFFLPDLNLFIEIKGYWTDFSIYKMKAVQKEHNISILIIDKEEDIKADMVFNWQHTRLPL